MLSGHQRIKWRRNIAENFNRLSRVHERYRRQTTTDDRRQTDGRRHIANMNMSSRLLKRRRRRLRRLLLYYDLGLIGKSVVDFLLVLIELFSLGVTDESLRTKRDRKSAISLQRGHFDPKFQVEGVALHQSVVHG